MVTLVDDGERAEHLATILKAIAHPLRLRIVAALCEGPEVVGSLAERLGAAPAIVSQELRILRMSGLVKAERTGGYATYSLAEPALKGLVKCIEKCPRA